MNNTKAPDSPDSPDGPASANDCSDVNILIDFLKLKCQLAFDNLDDFYKEFMIKLYQDDTIYLNENIQRVTDKKIINAMFFVTARFSKDIEIVKILKHYFENIDYRSKTNSTLLFCSIANDNLEMTKYLIEECKINVNHINNNGNNCLINAFMYNNLKLIKYLIEEQHADVHYVNKHNVSCIHTCCSKNCPDIIKYLINEYKMDIHSTDASNHGCLHYACMNNENMDTIIFLVEECGLQIDKLCILGALGNKNVNVIKYFVSKYQTDSDYEQVRNELLLKYLIPTIKNIETIKFLIEECEFRIESDDDNCLMKVCSNSANDNCDNFDVIKYFATLLKHRISDLNNKGKNCLMLVCQYNPNLEIIKFLIETCQLDFNKCNERKNNCLLLACYGNSNIEIIKFLIEECKMDIKHENIEGRNCLTLACMNKKDNMDIISYLLNLLEINTLVLNDNVSKKKVIKLIDLVCDDYDKFNSLLGMIEDSIFLSDVVILQHIRSKNPMLFTDYNRMIFSISDPFKLKYVEFTKVVDQLQFKIFDNLLDTDDMSYCIDTQTYSLYDIDQIYELEQEKQDQAPQYDDDNDDIDYSKPNDILFKHKGKLYYGYKQIVYQEIPVFKCIMESADFSEPVDLDIDVPEYIINLYIKSTYTKKFEIRKIKPYDFIKFIKMIDQYPTQILSIKRIEHKMLKYINSMHHDDLCDDMINYLSEIIKKYELKLLYIWVHNKNMK